MRSGRSGENTFHSRQQPKGQNLIIVEANIRLVLLLITRGVFCLTKHDCSKPPESVVVVPFQQFPLCPVLTMEDELTVPEDQLCLIDKVTKILRSAQKHVFRFAFEDLENVRKFRCNNGCVVMKS